MYRVSGFSGINYYRRLLLFGYTFVALCQDPFQNFGPWQVNVFRAQGVASAPWVLIMAGSRSTFTTHELKPVWSTRSRQLVTSDWS